MTQSQEYQTVILAGLLHDIGKFLQRGSFGSLDTKGKHPKVSGIFVSAYKALFAQVTDADLLKTLVEHHHESPSFRPDFSVQDLPSGHERSLAYLVSEADNLSSAERGEATDEYQDFKTTPLAPVFARITLKGAEKPTPLRYHARPLGTPASLGAIFPELFPEYVAEEMNNLLKAFGEEFARLAKGVSNTDFDSILTHLMGILQRYTWCIPSNTQEPQPDVSLYDHIKTTAAIAACLYRYHNDKGTLDEKAIKQNAPKFLMVVGDLSGIQNYIFDIATAGVGGVSRRLRSRSLFIQLITEVASHRILRDLNLPLTNIVMQSGGKFYLLLPNLPEVKQTVEKAQREIDQWLLGKLNGEIALNLAMMEFGHEGFKSEGGKEGSGFGQVLVELNSRMQERKRQPFKEVLSGSSGWEEQVFLRPTTFEGEKPCRSCGKFPGRFSEGDEKLCECCSRDTEWGRLIPSAKYIAFFADETSGDLPILGYSVSLRRLDARTSPYLFLKLNDPDINDLYACPALPRYLANHIPKAKDFECDKCRISGTCEEQREKGETDPATFQCITAHSNGRPLLGFLKADVDNLGKLFVFGLKRENDQKSYDTISRLTTLSRMLDLFFSGWIEHLTRDNEFKHCYTVFSGGDDLFLVGPWDEILALAEKVRADFGRYTGNPEITLSAGVFMNKARFPISRAAAEAEDAVEASKHYKDAEGLEKKDAVTVLGRPLPWTEWAFVKNQWEQLMTSGEKVSSAFLYNLLRYAKMWEDYSKNGNVLGLRFQPLLAYNLARNIDPRKLPQLHAWAVKLLKIPIDAEAKRVLDNLELIVSLVIFSRRGGKE